MEVFQNKPMKLSQELEQRLLQPPSNKVLTIDEQLKAPPPSPTPDHQEKYRQDLKKEES